MDARKDRTLSLDGLEKKLFAFMSKGTTEAEWAEWLRAPLELALVEGDQRFALALLAAGADGGAGWVGHRGRTLLGAAAEGGNHKLLSAVLEARGSEELDTAYGDEKRTALQHAIARDNTKAARVLMRAGANAGLLDRRGRNVLHLAVKGGSLQLIRDAIAGGADVNAADVSGDTPLHVATEYGDKAVVSALVRKGASVSAVNAVGKQPLHLAVGFGHVAQAEVLLKAGADPDVPCGKNMPPLSRASRSLTMTRCLLKNGADVEARDDNGFTALHMAARFGKQDVVEALLEAGADVTAQAYVDTRWRGDSALTPLHVAARHYKLGGMSTLLRNDAEVNAKDGNGRTPLHVLCTTAGRESDAVDAADLLLRSGADETLTDDIGRTPEQVMMRDGGVRLRKVLANAPADRAWRRRGLLVMYRAFPNKIPSLGGKGRAGKAKARRGRGRGGGSASGGRGRVDVLTKVLELGDDDIFRTIVGFL